MHGVAPDRWAYISQLHAITGKFNVCSDIVIVLVRACCNRVFITRYDNFVIL